MGLFSGRKQRAEVPQDDIIDLRTRLGYVDTQLDAATVAWGRPTRCPACHAPGYLDRIDLVHNVMYQRCPDCDHRWETAESEVTTAPH